MRVIIVDKDGFLVTKEDVLQVEFLGDRIAIELPNLKIDTLKLDTNIKTINFQDIAIDQVIFLEKEIAQLKDELKARKELCDLRYEQLKKQDEEIKTLKAKIENGYKETINIACDRIYIWLQQEGFYTEEFEDLLDYVRGE